jgi:hypothetical protein
MSQEREVICHDNICYLDKENVPENVANQIGMGNVKFDTGETFLSLSNKQTSNMKIPLKKKRKQVGAGAPKSQIGRGSSKNRCNNPKNIRAKKTYVTQFGSGKSVKSKKAGTKSRIHKKAPRPSSSHSKKSKNSSKSKQKRKPKSKKSSKSKKTKASKSKSKSKFYF